MGSFLFYYVSGYISEFMMSSLEGHFGKSILGFEFVEISEFLKGFVEIVRNCLICRVSVISDKFLKVLMGF